MTGEDGVMVVWGDDDDDGEEEDVSESGMGMSPRSIPSAIWYLFWEARSARSTS